jgi:hypothetical protein
MHYTHLFYKELPTNTYKLVKRTIIDDRDRVTPEDQLYVDYKNVRNMVIRFRKGERIFNCLFNRMSYTVTLKKPLSKSLTMN